MTNQWPPQVGDRVRLVKPYDDGPENEPYWTKPPNGTEGTVTACKFEDGGLPRGYELAVQWDPPHGEGHLLWPFDEIAKL